MEFPQPARASNDAESIALPTNFPADANQIGRSASLETEAAGATAGRFSKAGRVRTGRNFFITAPAVDLQLIHVRRYSPAHGRRFRGA
jgi:hypothetical protein